MKKKQAAHDKIMATKTDEKGLVIVHTGKGKGKSKIHGAAPAGGCPDPSPPPVHAA